MYRIILTPDSRILWECDKVEIIGGPEYRQP